MPKTKATFTASERAAMKARANELKKEAQKADGEKTLLAAVAAMPQSDKKLAKRIHEIVKTSAPGLMPKTWYGMPAWANKDGKVVCYFKPASKFQMRYAQFGFEDAAKLDDGALWPVVFGLTQLSATEERKIAALVKKAVR